MFARYLAAPPRMPGSASRRPPQPTDIQSTCLPVRSSIARGCAAAPMPGLEATSQGSTRSPKDLSPRYNIEGLDLSNFDQRSLRDRCRLLPFPLSFARRRILPSLGCSNVLAAL
eukprot:scaffold5904_cov30-Tisochrysis_lutea.AAC.3